MHRPDSFLSSGRVEMWKFIPFLFISPVLTVFVSHWDLPIYLSVIYGFTFAILTAFRRLCHEWTTWHLRIPSVTEKDMIQWFRKRCPDQHDTDDAILATAARVALTAAVYQIENQEPFWSLWNRRIQVDEFAGPIADNRRVIEYLLATHSGGSETPELFSSTWFVQFELALNNKKQMMRGLKEHSAFIHYRYSRYDVSGLATTKLKYERVTLIDWSKCGPLSSGLARPPHRRSHVGPPTWSKQIYNQFDKIRDWFRITAFSLRSCGCGCGTT